MPSATSELDPKVFSPATTQSPTAAIPKLRGGAYTAIRDVDGTYCLKSVEIFSEIAADERGNPEPIDRDWLEECKERMQFRYSAERQFIAPIHVNHHDKTTEPAGFFVPTEVKKCKLSDGTSLWTILADWFKMPAHIYRQIRENRLAYRSVEVIKYQEREIGSLALMADEVPYFRYALTTVGLEIDRAEQPAEQFRRDALFLFRSNDGGAMPNDMKKPDENKPGGDPSENEGKPNEKPEGGKENAGGGTVQMFAEIKAMFAGLVALLSGSGVPGGAPGTPGSNLAPVNPVGQMKAPTPIPAGSASASLSNPELAELRQSFAALSAEMVATKSKLATREQKESEESNFQLALKELEGRPMTDEIKEGIRMFAAKPEKEFRKFLDVLKLSLPIDSPTLAQFSASKTAIKDLPEEVVKFQAQGTQAFEHALGDFRALESHNAIRGVTQMSFERFQKIEKRRLASLDHTMKPLPASQSV